MRRVGGGEHDGRLVVVVIPLSAEPVDRAGDGELGGAEAGDEVAAAHLPPLLEGLEHGVHAGEPALGALPERRLAGEHAVALEQLERPGVGGFGGGRQRFEQRRHERPAPGAGRRAEPAQPARSWATTRSGTRAWSDPPSAARWCPRRRAAGRASRS